MYDVRVVAVNGKNSLYFLVGKYVNKCLSSFRKAEFTAKICFYVVVQIKPVKECPEGANVALYRYGVRVILPELPGVLVQILRAKLYELALSELLKKASELVCVIGNGMKAVALEVLVVKE